MQNLNVSIVQSDINWNDIEKNINHFSSLMKEINNEVDLIVLPEMFTTGFNMTPENIFETMNSPTIEWMREMASQKEAVVTGSLLMKDKGKFFNRLFWVYPDGHYETYDKRHLFSFVNEHKVFSQGNIRKVVSYKGIKFLLIICYDLRFPVWCKNRYKDGSYEYDAIVCVANWPQVRGHVWRLLLKARAVENQAYVIGVNRVGNDINGIHHSGDSMVICPKGEILAAAKPSQTETKQSILDMEELNRFRNRFFAAADWDDFTINV